MTRTALLLLAALLAACTTEEAQSCPGEQVGSFSFIGGRVAKGAPEIALFDPVPDLPDCGVDPGFPTTITPFSATLASDATGTAGVLCRANGPVLFGTRADNRWMVSDSTDGAVLAACDPTCAARSDVSIRGDVVPDAISPTGFQGALVEQLTQTAGSCGACGAPLSCAARYQLTGTVLPP